MIKKRVIIPSLLLLWVINLLAISSPLLALGIYDHSKFSYSTKYSSPDSIVRSAIDTTLLQVSPLDTVLISDDLKITTDERVLGRKDIPDYIKNRSIIELLSVHPRDYFFSFRLNDKYLSNEYVSLDSLLWMDHLIYPQQKKYETFTFLGSMGSPLQMDHFFSRDADYNFLFTRHLNSYSSSAINAKHYNVRTPYTRLYYSTAGQRSQVEQVFKVLHTQNVNKFFNFGFAYDFHGTKGVYENQETRNNEISLFSSYNKGNFSVQGSLVNKVYRHEENGGIKDHYFIQDTILETRFVPIWLNSAQSVSRERTISLVGNYTLVNIKHYRKDSLGKQVDSYIPLLSAKLILNHERLSRAFLDNSPSAEFFEKFYINKSKTNDSVFLQLFDAKALIEIAQFAKIPGMPGIRGWLGYTNRVFDFFQPQDFILSRSATQQETAHLGIVAFSESSFFSYQGGMRVYFTGYRSDDKEIDGEVKLSPWKNDKMPLLKGKLQISEKTPDIFLNRYFSNHFMWHNNFDKEKRFFIGGALESKGLQAEIGYNLMHIKDYHFFNELAMPDQAPDVTITSAYVQKNFKIGRGLNFFNRVVWQVNSNNDVLSLPQFIVFSSIFYEARLVKNVLTGQFGFNVFYRTGFYADSYQPATGQFYNQRKEMVGDYPVADVFANFKWKRAILYFKIDHINQGYPDSRYFATAYFPMNPLVFKYGVLWTFYN
jgi:hypothetical protein